MSWANEDYKQALQKTRIFTGKFAAANAPQRTAFYDRFGFYADKLLWTPDYGGRYLQPYIGPDYQPRGYVARDFDGSAGEPKALAFPEVADEPFIHWAFDQGLPRLFIIVEDWVSAEKLAVGKHATGISLCGTYIDYSRAMEISLQAKNNPVLVCLDNDATQKAFNYVGKFSEVFKNLIIRPLQKDIKDSSDSEIREIVRYGESFNKCGNQ